MPSVVTDYPRAAQSSPGQAPADTMSTSLAAAAVNSSIVPNIHAQAAPFANEYISPGSIYAGQWSWDSALTSILACSFGYAAHAAKWLANWPAFQLTTGPNAGMLPVNVLAGGAAYYDNSQIPVLARAAWTVYQSTRDAAALATLNTMLKAWYAWFEATHQDATGLAALRISIATGDPVADRMQAKLESGQDQCGPYNDGMWIALDEATSRMRYADPSLNAALVSEANYLSLIATILGNSADASTYAAKRDARKALMNAYLWDATQGVYQHVQMADYARPLGNLALGATAGATTITLGAPPSSPLDRGQLIDFGGGITAQSAYYYAAGQASTIALFAPLPSAVASGTPVKSRAFVNTKSLGSIALPLWANVPSQAQAEAMVRGHLTKHYTGAQPETSTIVFGSGRDNGLTETHVHTEWHPTFAGSYTLAADSLVGNASGGQVVCSVEYRKATDPYLFLPFDPSEEALSPAAPLRIAVIYQGTADAAATIAAYDPAGNLINGGQATGPTGSGTQIVALTLTGSTPSGPFAADSGAVLPGRVDIGVSAGSHPVTIQAIYLETSPRGTAYLTDHGLLAQPDKSRFSLATQVGGTIQNALASEPDPSDYWRGDHWVNLEWFAITGMLGYGMSADAREIARRVVTRCDREYRRSGKLWERYSRRGVGHGAVDYGWSGLGALLAETFNL